MFKFTCRAITVLSIAAGLFVPNINDAKAADTKIVLGVPAYVYHPKDRPGVNDWNDGWFNNEGVFADVTWPVWELSDKTTVRAGFAAGGFDNSIYKTSFFGGGAAEVETFLTDKTTANLGIYVGGVTGYDNGFGPAAAPYVGAAYSFNKVDVGLRGIWLPAETIAGSDLAPSDAYIAALTIGKRF